MKIEFDEQKQEWVELPKYSKEGIYIDGKLKQRLDFVRKILKENWDAPILIDGAERSGKSTLAMTLGWYLSNCKLSIENFAIGLEDAINKIKILPDGSVLIIDEGSLIFHSRDSMMRGQRKLMKIFDVVGQMNMIFIVCLPSFFDLNKQIAVRRSRFLLHVYKSKDWKRGRFAYFNERKKRVLYEIGKKNFGSYKKPKSNFYGTFTIFEPPFYKEYLKFKRKTMLGALETEDKVNVSSLKTELMCKFKENCPETTDKVIAKGFSICLREFYRRKQLYLSMKSE